MNGTTMTVDEAAERYLIIVKAARDPATAHELEDQLMRDVLKIIATGDLSPPEAAKLASIALKSSELDFPRWPG